MGQTTIISIFCVYRTMSEWIPNVRDWCMWELQYKWVPRFYRVFHVSILPRQPHNNRGGNHSCNWLSYWYVCL